MAGGRPGSLLTKPWPLRLRAEAIPSSEAGELLHLAHIAVIADVAVTDHVAEYAVRADAAMAVGGLAVSGLQRPAPVEHGRGRHGCGRHNNAGKCR